MSKKLEQRDTFYFRKSTTCERYDLYWERGGWAIITIDEDGGVFNAQSDYENYAYSWPHHGCKSFKHFIVSDLARDKSYFLHKISRKTHFDYQNNLENWKRTLIEIRREECCTKEQAREAWTFLVGLSEYSISYHAIQMQIFESAELENICDEPWNVFEVDLEYPPHAVMFAEKVLPKLAEVLKEELEKENK